MCLHTVSRKITASDPLSEGIGWKMIQVKDKPRRDEDRVLSLVRKFNHVTPWIWGALTKLPLYQWIKAEDVHDSYSPTIGADDGWRYDIGFHIWENEKDALEYFKGYENYCAVYPVLYRGAHTLGTGWNDSKQVVAKEIMVMPMRI